MFHIPSALNLGDCADFSTFELFICFNYLEEVGSIRFTVQNSDTGSNRLVPACVP
jgi:hypothetical protein